ncbi:MAG: Arc family DNA-binding protein [Puniceicoccaceae bacterium]|nr:MAG: Arc family DNA-binding protein [Puniceicoccaceae bacterium]
MKSITLKNVPEDLLHVYRQRARRHARSLNREILQTLAAAAPEIAGRKEVLARIRQRVVRQAARRKAAGNKPLSTMDFLEAIRKGRE